MTLFRKHKSKDEQQQDFQTTVRFLDDSEPIQLVFTKETLGQYVLDKVCETLNLMEKDYFGLRFVDAEKQRHWLDPTKTVYKQLKGVSPCVLCFRVKFYPADPTKLHEEITRYYLFLQLRRDLHHGRLLCSPQDANLLAAYIIQSEVGDYDIQDHPSGYVAEFKMLPNQTTQQEQQIQELHKSLIGQVPAEAEANFLKKAASLDTYGVDPHKVKDQKGNQVYIGVTHQGIMTFHGSRRTQSFKWSQIKKLAFEGKTFIAHIIVNEKHQPIGYKCLTVAACKYLWRCAVEQQYFFTLPNSSHVANVRSGGSLFSRGSKFRFSGKCQNEAYHASEEIKRKEPDFQRTSSLPKFSRKTDVVMRISNTSISEENSIDVAGTLSTVVVESPIVNAPVKPAEEEKEVVEDITPISAAPVVHPEKLDTSKQNGGIPIIVTMPGSVDLEEVDVEANVLYNPDETMNSDEDGMVAKSLEEQVIELEKQFQLKQERNQTSDLHVNTVMPLQTAAVTSQPKDVKKSITIKKGGYSCRKIFAYTFFSMFVTFAVTSCVVMFSDIDHPVLNEARSHLVFLEPVRDFITDKYYQIVNKF